MQGTSVALGTRTHTFATAASLADVDAFKESIATAAAAVTYSGATLTGALANPGPVTVDMMGMPRYPSVTSSSVADQYNTTDPIIFTGTRDGAEATVEVLLTAAGGGETITGAAPLDTLSSIYVPAMLDTSGALEFGFDGIACRRAHGRDQRMAFKANGTGTVKCGYPGGFTDSLPVTAGTVEAVSAYRIYADTTDVGITIYE